MNYSIKSITELSLPQKRLLLTQLLEQKASQAISQYPLSYGQQALWFLYQSSPESSAYNVAFNVRIYSELDFQAFERAIQTLVTRHPSLRSTFSIKEDQSIQQVYGYQKVNLKRIDGSKWTEDELTQNVFNSYQQPFNLLKGPLLRASLFSCSEQDHVFLLTIHHIACDGWSLWILVDELQALYTAEINKIEASLPPLDFCFEDYVSWHEKIITSSYGTKLGKYWQEQLSGEISILNLPIDNPRPLIQSYEGSSHTFSLSKEITEQLKKISQSEGCTLYMTLLAAFQTLLYRYTGQQEFLIGSPVTGRSQPEWAPIVGSFVNSIVLKAKFEEDCSFKEVLAQTRKTLLEAISHQEYPFPLLVEKLQLNHDISRSPLFQANFVFQNPQQSGDIVKMFLSGDVDSRTNWGDLTVGYFGMPQQEGQFDLTLEMAEGTECLVGVFKYNSNLFEPQTIARITDNFQTLLQEIATDHHQSVSLLPFISSDESAILLSEWNKTEIDYVHNGSLHNLFEEQVIRTPNNVAVIFDQKQITYQELNYRANQLANHLKDNGMKPGHLAGVCIERSLELVVSLLGVLKAGGAYIPLDPSYPQERLDYMLSDSQVSILLTQEGLGTDLSENIASIIFVDRDWDTIAQASNLNPNIQLAPYNLAYVIYTSGSTGKPKGVMISHRAICNHMFWMQQTFPLVQTDKVLQKTPFSFDASVWEFYAPLLVGAQLLVALPDGHKDPNYLIDTINQHQVNVIQLVPSLLQMLLEQKDFETCVSLKRIFCGGEPLTSELQENLFDTLDTELINLYGPTETCIDASFWICCSKYEHQLVPIGRPIRNTQIYILDQHLQLVPIGVSGELYIGGVGLAEGYLNRPDLTAQKFIQNPHSTKSAERIYKTGDLARYLPDGNIEYLGRLDYQVKIRGFRIELEEIETLLNRHEDIQKALVIAREDNDGDKRLTAYVIPKVKITSINKLRVYLQKSLPDYMVPKDYVQLETFPLTPNGKVDRRNLPIPSLLRESLEKDFVSPRNQVELKLLNIWSDILRVSPIGVQDRFFDLGGHSLLAIRLMSQIKEQFGKDLSLSTLFQSPTIEQLAVIICQETDTDAWSPLVKIQPEGLNTPFFCIHPIGGNVTCYADLAKHLGSEQPFFALQSPCLNPKQESFNLIEEMAAHYIESIKSIQPRGPYQVGGWSLGGVIAFEIAQQLQLQGHQISSLALIDSYSPTVIDLPEKVDHSLIISSLVKDLSGLFGKKISISVENLREKSLDEQLNQILTEARNLNVLPPEFRLPQMHQLLKVFQTNLQAIHAYKPQLYDGKISLFYAQKKVLEPIQDITQGWGSLVTNSIEIIKITGDHYSLLREPSVQILAERIKEHLNE